MRLTRLVFFSLTVILYLNPPLLSQDSKENADFKLAVNLFNDKLYDLALEQFKQFINLYPSTPSGIEARFYLGLTDMKLGKFDDARFAFQNFALAYPDNPKAPEAWTNVAEAYVALNNLREAALAYERVKTFHPKSKFAPQGLLKAADLYERLGDRDGIKRALRTLTQDYSTPEVLSARLKLAELSIADRDYESAELESRRVLDATKDAGLRTRAILSMSDAMIALGKFSDAESALNELIRNYRPGPATDAALLSLGRLRLRTGKAGDAIAAWQTAADDSLKGPAQIRQDALLAMGDLLNLQREYGRALASYERASAIRGDRNGEAWYKAGVAAERSKDPLKAGQYYRRAVGDSLGRFDPRPVLIGGIKGATSAKNYSEAASICERYVRLFPQDSLVPRILLDEARIQREYLKDPSRAAALFGQVVESYPGTAWVDDALFGWAQSLEDAGRFEDALGKLRELERRFPCSEFADEAQTRIRLIGAFELKDREAGLEKLSLLVGDVIAQKGRGDLAYRLADIYAQELKDYPRAITQYQAALQSDLAESNRPAARLAIAESYALLALREESNHGPKGDDYLREAIASYDTLERDYPSSPQAGGAVVEQLNLRLRLASTPADVRKLGSDFLASFPTASRKDLALLALASSYETLKNFDAATLTYKLILESYRHPDTAPEALFQLGWSLDQMGEKDSAATVLAEFLAANADHRQSARAAVLLARYESAKGHPQRAIAYIDRIAEKYFYCVDRSSFEEDLGDAYANAGDNVDAVPHYRRAVAAVQNDFFRVEDVSTDLLFKLAVACDKSGNRQDAKSFYAEYLARDTRTERAGEVYYALALIAKAENNFDAAARYLQESARFASQAFRPVSLETAELYFRDEKYADAATKYAEAAQSAKDDSVLQYLESRIVVCYFRLDNLKEADKRATAFVKRTPNASRYAAEFEFERGKYFLRKEDIRKAQERFALVGSQYPSEPIAPDALYWMARTYELDEKPQMSAMVYDSLIRTYPNAAIVPHAELSLGNVYYNLEQWDAAAKEFKAILADEDRSPDLVPFAMNNLILAYKELGLYDGALELTRKYIERFPNDSDLIDKKIDIGILYRELGYYDQSIVHLQSLLENGNSDLEAELRYYIGEAYFYKGDLQQAILEFLKVPYLVTRRGKMDWVSTAYYMAGQSYEKMSKYDEAITMYRQIIDRKDTDAEFKTAAQKEIDRVNTLVGKRN
ncbi:MAG TPA: tetratricopeptide repeat protein [Bacteroidota bacterium]|nr:tetratricopeptide repeat protein [Bacteroidota bacterium]